MSLCAPNVFRCSLNGGLITGTSMGSNERMNAILRNFALGLTSRGLASLKGGE